LGSGSASAASLFGACAGAAVFWGTMVGFFAAVAGVHCRRFAPAFFPASIGALGALTLVCKIVCCSQHELQSCARLTEGQTSIAHRRQHTKARTTAGSAALRQLALVADRRLVARGGARGARQALGGAQRGRVGAGQAPQAAGHGVPVRIVAQGALAALVELHVGKGAGGAGLAGGVRALLAHVALRAAAADRAVQVVVRGALAPDGAEGPDDGQLLEEAVGAGAPVVLGGVGECVGHCGGGVVGGGGEEGGFVEEAAQEVDRLWGGQGGGLDRACSRELLGRGAFPIFDGRGGLHDFRGRQLLSRLFSNRACG